MGCISSAVVDGIEPSEEVLNDTKDIISGLPTEVALMVLSYLEPKDLLSAAQTCKIWRELADTDTVWWDKCDEADITYVYPTLSAKATYLIDRSWRMKQIQPKTTIPLDDLRTMTLWKRQVVTGGTDGTLKIWSVATADCLRTLVGHTGAVLTSDMSRGYVVSGGNDCTLKMWNAETGRCIRTLRGHTSPVQCLQLLDKHVVSGSQDCSVRLWNMGGQCLHVLTGHSVGVTCVHCDGRYIVSGDANGHIKLWNPQLGKCLRSFQNEGGPIVSLIIEEEYVVGGSNGCICVWLTETGGCLRAYRGFGYLLYIPFIGPLMQLNNGVLVATYSSLNVKAWDISSGKVVQIFSGIDERKWNDSGMRRLRPPRLNDHRGNITGVLVIHRFVITSSYDGSVKMWMARSGEFIRNLVSLRRGREWIYGIQANKTKLVCYVGFKCNSNVGRAVIRKLIVIDFGLDEFLEEKIAE